MYKTIFVNTDWENESAGAQIANINGEVLLFGETAFSSVEQAIAAAGNNGAVVISVASGKYDAFGIVNTAGEYQLADKVVAVDFNGGEAMIGGEVITVADSGLDADTQAMIISDLNNNATNGKVFVAAEYASADATTLYVGMGDMGYVAGASAAVVSGQDYGDMISVLTGMYGKTENAINAVSEPQTICVNSDFTSETDGWGTTHFADYASAVQYISTLGKSDSVTIVVENVKNSAAYDAKSVISSTEEAILGDGGRLNVNTVINDGARVDFMVNKLDLTYDITVKAGGILRTTRGNFTEVHIKSSGNLIAGEAGGKRAIVNLMNGSSKGYDVLTTWGSGMPGKISMVNTDFSMRDLSLNSGTGTFTDCLLNVNGALNAAVTMTLVDSTVNVLGKHGHSSSYFKDYNNLANVVMSNSSIVIDDKSDSTVADRVELKSVTMDDGSQIIVENGTAVTVNGAVKILNGSSLNVGALTVNKGKKITLDGTSQIVADTLTMIDNSGIVIDLTKGFDASKPIIDVKTALTETDLTKITVSDGYSAYIQEGDIYVMKGVIVDATTDAEGNKTLDLSADGAVGSNKIDAGDKNVTLTTGDKETTDVTDTAEIKSDVSGKNVTIENSKNLAVTGSIEASDSVEITNAGSDAAGNEATLNGGAAGTNAKITAENNIVMNNSGHAEVELKAKNIIIANNSKNTLTGVIGSADTGKVIIADGEATADGVTIDGNGTIDGAVKDATITATNIAIGGQEVSNSTLTGRTAIISDSKFSDVTAGGVVSVGYDAENAADTTLTLDGNTSIGTLYVGKEGRENEYKAVITGEDTEVTLGNLYNRTDSVVEFTDGATANIGYWQSKGSVLIDDATVNHTGVNMYVYNNDSTSVAEIKLTNGAVLNSDANYAIYLGNSEGGPAKGNAKITLESGSNLNTRNLILHADGTVEEVAGAAAKTSVSVTDSTVNVSGTLTNNGTFTVAGESTLNIAELTGNTITALDGTKLTDTTIASASSKELVIGEQEVASTVTFAGDNKIAKISAGAGDSVIVEAGASLELTGNRSAIGSGATWSINGNIADAKAVTDEEKAGLTVAFNAVNGLSLSDYSGSTTTWNINDAYAKIGTVNGVTSKNDNNAGGKFEINITNSIFESASKWAINTPKNNTITNQPAFELNVKDSVFTVGNYYTNNQKNSVANVDNSKFSATAFGNIGEFNVTNGAEATFGLANAVQDWASKGSLNAGKLYVNDASFTITNTSIEFYNVGDIVLEDGATVTFGKLVNAAANDVTLGAINTTFADQVGSITIDADAKFIAGTLTNNGTITITNEAAGWTGHNKVIDLSGTESLEGKINIENLAEGVRVIYGSDGDVTLTDADMSKFYVNTAYAGKAYGDKVGEKLYFGVNAFDNYETALNAAPDGMEIDVVGSNPYTFYIGKSDSDTDVTVNFTGDVKALWKNSARVDAGSTGNVINGSTLEYPSVYVRGTLNVGSADGETGIVTGKNFNIYGENGYPAAEVNVYSGSTLKVNDGSQNTSYVGHGSDANRKGVLNVLGGTVEAKYLKVNAGTGEINVENGTLTVGGALTNNGTVNVTGESTVKAKVSGNGWVYMDGVSLDENTNLTGANVRFASGTNTVDGATINGGRFQVGTGTYQAPDSRVDSENGVVVNVKNNAHIGGIDGSASPFGGWVGSEYYDAQANKDAAMTDARYTLNIDKSIAEFGYMHVSHDGILNVTGDADELHSINATDYSFRTGYLNVNGVATFDNTTAMAFNTNVGVDNNTDNPGKLVITNGTVFNAKHEDSGLAANFKVSNTGIVEVSNGATFNIGQNGAVLNIASADAKFSIDNATLNAGNITNNGTVNVTSSEFNADKVSGTGAFNIGTSVDADGNAIATTLNIGSLEQNIYANKGGVDPIALTGSVNTGNTIRVYGDATVENMKVNGDYTGAMVSGKGAFNVYGDTLITGDTVMNLNAFQTTNSGVIDKDVVINTANFNAYDMGAANDGTVVDAKFVVKGELNTVSFIVTNDYYSPKGKDELIVDKDGVVSAVYSSGHGRYSLQTGKMTVYGYAYGNLMAGGGESNIGEAGGGEIAMNLTVDGIYASADSNNGKFVKIGDQKLTIYEDSQLNVINGALFSWEGDVINREGASITVSDSTFEAGSITNNGYFNLSVSSDLFNSLTGEFVLVEQTGDAGMDVTKLTVNVAGTNYEVGKSWEVGGIQYTLSTGTGNDVILAVKPQEFIVDASFNEETPGYGFNKFSSLEAAIDKVGSSVATIKVTSDLTVSSTIDKNFSGAVEIVADENVTIDFADEGFYPQGANVTFGENVNVTGVSQAIVYGALTINGNWQGEHLWTFGYVPEDSKDTSLTINETAKVQVGTQLEFRGGTVTINGALESTEGVLGDADKIQLLGTTYGAWGGDSGYKTKVYLNDTYVKVAQVSIGGSSSWDKFADGSSCITILDNSILEIASEGRLNVLALGKVNVTNGSILQNGGFVFNNAGQINVEDSALNSTATISNTGSIALENSSLSAKTVTNTGTFSVTGDSTVNIDKLTSTTAVTFGGAEDRSELTIGSASGNGVAIDASRLNIYKSDVTLTDNVSVGAPAASAVLHKIQDSTIDLNGKTMTYKGFIVLDSYAGVSSLGSNQGVTIKNGEFNVTDSAHLCFQGYDHVIAENATVNFVGASGSSMVNVYGSLTVNGKLYATHDESTQHGYDNVGTTDGDPNTGFPKEAYPQSVLTVSGVNAEYIIENGHMFNVIHETASTGAGIMNIVNGATFSFTGADGRSDVGLFFNSNIVNVDAQSSFTVGNYRGYDQSGKVKGSFNSTNAGEMIVLGDVNVLYNLKTSDLIVAAGATLTAGTITVDSLTVDINSELTFGTGSSITDSYITVTGSLNPENAEFTLVAKGWDFTDKLVYFDANYDGTISSDEHFTVGTKGAENILFDVKNGNLYVKKEEADVSGIYIGEFTFGENGNIVDADGNKVASADELTEGLANGETFKLITDDGAAYEVGKDAFDSVSDAANSSSIDKDIITEVTIGKGDHIDYVAENFTNVEKIKVTTYGDVEGDEANFNKDVVINNDGHLDAKINVTGNLSMTNTSHKTLLNEITVTGNYDLVNSGTAGGDAADYALGISAKNITIENQASGIMTNVMLSANEIVDLSGEGTWTNVDVKADALVLNGIDFTLDAGTNVNDVYLGDYLGRNVDGGTLTLKADALVDKVSGNEDGLSGKVVFDGANLKDVTIDNVDKVLLATGDHEFSGSPDDNYYMNNLEIGNASLTWNFADDGIFNIGPIVSVDDGRVKVSSSDDNATLNFTQEGEYNMDNFDVTGFTKTVNVAADSTITLDDAAEYFGDGANINVNGTVNLDLADKATGVTFAKAGDINVNASQTFTADKALNEFSGDLTVAAGKTLTLDKANDTAAILHGAGDVVAKGDLELDTATAIKNFSGDIKADGAAVTVKLNGANETNATFSGNGKLDVAADQTFKADAALDNLTGSMNVAADKTLTLTGTNTTNAAITGSGDVIADNNQTFNGDVSAFTGSYTANAENTVEFNGTFAEKMELNGTGKFNFAAKDKDITINSDANATDLCITDNDVTLASGKFGEITGTDGSEVTVDNTITAGSATVDKLIINQGKQLTVGAVDVNDLLIKLDNTNADWYGPAITVSALVGADSFGTITVDSNSATFKTPFTIVDGVDAQTYNSEVYFLLNSALPGVKLTIDGIAVKVDDKFVMVYTENGDLKVANYQAASSVVYVNSDWTDNDGEQFQWQGIGGADDTLRIIGRDSAKTLAKALATVSADDNGRGTIYMVKAGTYASDGAFMTSGINGNEVTNMVINGNAVDPDKDEVRVGEVVFGNGVVAMDSLRSGSLTLNNISVAGNVYGAAVVNGNVNAETAATELTLNGGYYLSSQITGGADVQSGNVKIGSSKLTISNTYAAENGDDLTMLGRVIGGASIGKDAEVTQNSASVVIELDKEALNNAEKQITLRGDIYAAGSNLNGGTLNVENSSVMFTGNAANLAFTGRVSGGIYGERVGSFAGNSELVFSDFVSSQANAFKALVQDFDVITVSGDTELYFSRKQTLCTSTTINFEVAGNNTGNAMMTLNESFGWNYSNTISIKEMDWKSGTYTLVSGSDVADITNVKLGDQTVAIGETITDSNNDTYLVAKDGDTVKLTYTNNNGTVALSVDDILNGFGSDTTSTTLNITGIEALAKDFAGAKAIASGIDGKELTVNGVDDLLNGAKMISGDSTVGDTSDDVWAKLSSDTNGNLTVAWGRTEMEAGAALDAFKSQNSTFELGSTMVAVDDSLLDGYQAGEELAKKNGGTLA